MGSPIMPEETDKPVIDGGVIGVGRTTRESALALRVPSTSSSAFSDWLPGPAVRFTPAQRYSRSVAVIVTAAFVMQEIEYSVSVTERAVEPVAVHRAVPLTLFRFNLARGT